MTRRGTGCSPLWHPYCFHKTWSQAMKCARWRAKQEHRHMYVRKVRRPNPRFPQSRWTVRISR